MKIINVHQAKSQLSKLIARAIKGEEIIIGRAGTPVARLTAFDVAQKPRTPGLLRGKIKISKDFDEMPAGLLKYFKG